MRGILTPGQAGDALQASALLDGFWPARVLADKVYDSGALQAPIAAIAVIPCNPTRKHPARYDRNAYKSHDLIKRMFCRFKGFGASPLVAASAQTHSSLLSSSLLSPETKTEARGEPSSEASSGVIGWILLSREAVARAEEALASGERGVRDEVGFLALHQGFADRFFPGTSVLHTRLRYVLFVPWLMQKVAANAGPDLVQKFASAETALAGQLKAGPDPDGVIGGHVWPRPAAQPPSMSYWNALGTWGILRPRPDGSMPSRNETLRRLARHRRPQRTRVTDDDGVALDEDPSSPFVMLPPTPEALGFRHRPLDFTLTPAEGVFLRKHLLGVRRPGTAVPCLLARLTEERVGSDAADLWVTEIADTADEEDRAALDIARQAAALAGIGRAVYAALVEIAHAKDGFPESTIHRNHLKEMVEIYGHSARTIDLWALKALLPNLSDDLSRILFETRNWLTAGETNPASLYDAYAKAEHGRKGLRARLSNTVAGRQRRAEWDPYRHPLAKPLHYRWPNVRRLLADLLAT